MKLDTTLSNHIARTADVLDGKQVIFRFDNGYGASVVNHKGSYGTELAVLKFDDSGDHVLDYSTSVTDDVLGHLDLDGVTNALYTIKDL